MALEYKSVPFSVKAADRNADDTGWEIAGLASTWWGEPDAYNDVVAPGAFSRSIAERATKFLFEHQIPIGKQIEIRETDEGLYGRWSVVDTTAGTDAYKLAKAGVLDSLSIGYVPLEWEIRDDGVRVLQTCTLFEVSCVAIPANTNAVITDVKADKAVWSSSYISNLSDAAFALILPGGEKDETGRTTPRSLRKLPHHNSDMELDPAHVRNGLSRAPQMTGVTEAQRDRAIAHLERHRDAMNKAAEHEVPPPFERLRLDHEQRRRRLAKLGIALEAI